MPAIVLLGTQWGDEGKGKIIDVLAEKMDVIVRHQGGPNAGHTVIIGDRKQILHHIPSGILRSNCRCVIGSGVVVDPERLILEMDEVAAAGIPVTPGRLLISAAAHVILPYHKALDGLQEDARGAHKLGTTRRGIGPAYMDKVGRSGIRVYDLLSEERFRRKLEPILRERNLVITRVYGGDPVDLEETVASYLGYADRIRPFVGDDAAEVNAAIRAGRRVLFEGAQGSLLDLDFGTYPFVTSSNTTAGGACTGSGVGPTRIDRVLGVTKAYTTRVGEGPFPTEADGDLADRFRNAGPIGEYGATTGRPRRCGWFDAVLVRRGILINGVDSIALTRLDVLSEFDSIRICNAYRNGTDVRESVPIQPEEMAGYQPVYEEVGGWRRDISRARRFEDLPVEARNYVGRLEQLLGVPVVIISVGPDRESTIVRESLV